MFREFFFFFQAEDGIRDAQESRGLGDVYKRQVGVSDTLAEQRMEMAFTRALRNMPNPVMSWTEYTCLLYTSDAADDLLCVDLGGRRIIKKKNKVKKYTSPQRREHTSINSIVTTQTYNLHPSHVVNP